MTKRGGLPTTVNSTDDRPSSMPARVRAVPTMADGRRSDETMGGQLQLAGAGFEKRHLRRAGKHDGRRRARAGKLLDKRESSVSSPLTILHRIRNDDDRRAGRREGIGGSGHPRVHAVDRPGLEDVERLAGRDLHIRVDDPDAAHSRPPRETLSRCAADGSRAKDGDRRHGGIKPFAICYLLLVIALAICYWLLAAQR